MRRFATWLLDTGPIVVLAAIAGAGSFTHIRATATDHGQTGWMSWAIAICVDLTCVMAARERHHDKRSGRVRHGLASWPTLVLTGGIVLSLAANLQQATPTPWGWITAATPAAAFLIAVSMLERRANAHPNAAAEESPAPTAEPALVPDEPARSPPAEPTVLTPQDEPPGPSPQLLDYARRAADEHQTRHGKPITRDALRARLGVSNQLASDLLRTLRTPRPEGSTP
ncbi:DUF2637 domain-containing protein [Nonomuraea typhae]|uniref:DUF2637 domain-containing protein n=1 Tax=Nonomuraea typhae TaxID=2603600 RepID=UPI0012F7F517|nr:DUF2637 domain-containing protein [Nonomuraea typhae]